MKLHKPLIIVDLLQEARGAFSFGRWGTGAVARRRLFICLSHWQEGEGALPFGRWRTEGASSTLLFLCLSFGCQGMWCSLLGRRGTAKERVWLGAWLAHLGVSPRLQWKKTFRFPFADEGSPGRGQATEKGAKGISNKTGVWRVADDKHQFSTKLCSLGREICQHIANYNLLHNHRLPARILYPSQPIIYCTAIRPWSTMHSQPMCDVSMAIGGYADTTFSHGFRMLEIAYCFWAQISPTSWLLNDWLKDFWWDLSDTC